MRDEKLYLNHIKWLNNVTKNLKDYKSLIESEIIDLYRGDLPYFYTKGGSRKVLNSNAEVTLYKTKRSGVRFLFWRMAHIFSTSDYYQQAYLINLSFVLSNSKK